MKPLNALQLFLMAAVSAIVAVCLVCAGCVTTVPLTPKIAVDFGVVAVRVGAVADLEVRGLKDDKAVEEKTQ